MVRYFLNTPRIRHKSLYFIVAGIIQNTRDNIITVFTRTNMYTRILLYVLSDDLYIKRECTIKQWTRSVLIEPRNATILHKLYTYVPFIGSAMSLYKTNCDGYHVIRGIITLLFLLKLFSMIPYNYGNEIIMIGSTQITRVSLSYIVKFTCMRCCSCVFLVVNTARGSNIFR